MKAEKMKTTLDYVKFFMFLKSTMIKQRLAARCTAAVIAACLMVAFALPGEVWAEDPYSSPSFVALWSGNGSGLESIKGSTASTTGSTPYAAGIVGQAFNFPDYKQPGVTRTTVIAGTNTNQVPTSYSISLWFKTPTLGKATGTAMWLMGKAPGHMEFKVLADGAIMFDPVPGVNIVSAGKDGSAYIIGQGVKVKADEWNHVVGTYSHNLPYGNVRLYVNGVLAANAYSPGRDMGGWSDTEVLVNGVATGTRWAFGASNIVNNTEYFIGQLQQIAVFDHPLSDAAALSLFQTAPVHYTVSFNSTDGSTVADQNVLYSSTAAIPVNPTSTGYTFDHWCTNALLTTAFDFITPITTDTTLYAKWQVNNSAVHILGTASPLDSAVVSFWPGNGSFNNMVTTGNDAVSNGNPAVSYADGKPGAKAFSLSGANYLAAADHPALHAPSYSISLWFKASSTEPQFLTAKGFEHMEIHTNQNGGIRFIPVTGMFVDTPAGAYSVGTWTHVVATYNYETGKGIMYVNGSDSHATANFDRRTNLSADPAPFYLGVRSNSMYKFTGQIQQVRLFGSALAAADVTNLYKDTLTLTPIASWSGDSTGDNLAPSAVPVTAYDATNTQTAIAYADGRHQAFNFTGTNYLTVADTVAGGATPLHNKSYSMSLWFKATSTGPQFLTAKMLEHMEIHTNTDGSIRFIPVSGMYVDTPAGAYSAGTWTHIVATYDYATGTGTMYVNGVTQATRTLAAIDMSADTTPYYLAVRNDGGYKFTGLMAQVALFDRALTDQEASDLYRFEASVAYTVTSSVTGGNGTVSCASPIYTGGTSSCTITPSGGYYLATFTDNGEDKLSSVSNNSYTISSIGADHTIVATFVRYGLGGLTQEPAANVVSYGLGGLTQNMAANVVSYWPGNGSLNNMVTTGNDAVSNGYPAVSYADGKPGTKAFSLSGANGLAAADHPALHVPSHSISLWFKASSTGLYFLTGKGMEHMEIHTNGNGSIRFIPVTGMYVDTPAGAYSAGTWTHVVATYDYATGKGTMYVNGAGTHATTNFDRRLDLSADSTPLYIGVRSDGGDKFAGQIQQVQLFGSALSAADVTKVYNGFSPQTPVASWSGNGSGANMVTNGPPVTAGKGSITYAAGRELAFYFTGTNFLSVADSTALHLPSYSTSFWFKAGKTGIQFLTAKGMEHMEIHLDANGVPGSIRFIPVTGMYVDTPATAYRTGIWTHVVATYNYATGTGTMYVNGGNKVTRTLAAKDMSADPVKFLMGVRNDGSYGYTGLMEQVGLFGRALSDQEALDMYNNSRPVL